MTQTPDTSQKLQDTYNRLEYAEGALIRMKSEISTMLGQVRASLDVVQSLIVQDTAPATGIARPDLDALGPTLYVTDPDNFDWEGKEGCPVAVDEYRHSVGMWERTTVLVGSDAFIALAGAGRVGDGVEVRGRWFRWPA